MAQYTKKTYALIVSLLGLTITTLVGFLYFFQPAVLKQLDLEIYDFFLEQSIDNTPHPIPVILDIDEASLEKYGQWPWSRYRLAKINDILLSHGALAVALDIVLAEEDRTSPELLKKTLNAELGVDLDFLNLPEELYDNDAYFAKSLIDKPIVLGSYLRFAENEAFSEEERKVFDKSVPNAIEFQKDNAIPAITYLPKPTGVTMPIPELAENGQLAFFNIAMDDDGIARSAQMVVSVDGKIFPSLAVKALMLATKQKALRINSNEYGLESIVIGRGKNSFNVPLSNEGMLNIPYQGPSKTFPYISAADLLDGKVDPSLIKNKIVFIGTSAAGLLDIRATPLDTFFPGVEVHANILDSILTQNFILTPNWVIGLQLCLLFLNGLIFTIIFSKVRPAYTMTTLLAFAALYFWISWYLYQKDYFISPLWQILLIFVLGLGLTAVRFWWEEKDKRKLRNIFGRYVSPDVVARIVEHGDIMLEGEERELSIMFTDVRGFTSISEKFSPQEVLSILNNYFTPMTALVRSAEGTLDKFIGDAIMAFWNAPLNIENHAQKAVLTAINMLEELENINIGIKENYGITLNMGVGIHIGPAYVGNMGSADLTSYTVIGDTVNTASRLEGLCSKFGFRIIISGEVVDKIENKVIPVANLRVKGRSTPIEIYTVFSERESDLFKDEIDEYLIAYNLFRECIDKKDKILLKKTIKLFEILSEKYSRGVYKEYSENCLAMQVTETDEWNSVWTLTSK